MNQYMAWAAFSALTFLLLTVLHRKFREHEVFRTIREKYRKEAEEKRENEDAFHRAYGAVENSSIFYRMDRLILTSGIRNRIPWMNGERYLLCMLAAGILGVIEGMTFTGNGFFALFLGAAQSAVLFAAVLALSGRMYDRIEDSTSIFVSLLTNHARSSSDIVTIMQAAGRSMDGPIRKLIDRFVLDAERIGNVDLAFDCMKESVDNRQLRTILVNLKNCMHYQANYEEVLTQMTGQIAESLSARAERKNILFSMKLTLIVISIASVFIVWVIGKGIGVDVIGILTGNMAGQVILLLTGILYLFVAMKLFGTDK